MKERIERTPKYCVIRVGSKRLHFSEEQVKLARRMAHAIRAVEAKSLMMVGKLLVEMKDSNGFYLCLEGGIESAGGDEYFCAYTEDEAWNRFVDTLGISRQDAYRKMRIYSQLIEPHKEIFELWSKEGKIPAVRRLHFLATGDRADHPQIEDLLNAARGMERQEWETYTRITFEALDEDEAAEAAEAAAAELKRRRKAAAKREQNESEKALAVELKNLDAWRRTSSALVQRIPWHSSGFRAFVATRPCLVSGRQGEQGSIHAHHLVPKSQGGDDWRNLIPLHHTVHAQLHTEGITAVLENHPDWSREDLEAAADELSLAYLVQLEYEAQARKENT